MPIIIKAPEEIARMREAGRINALALEAVTRAVRAGITTYELDAIAAEVLHSHGASPAFLGYPNRIYPDHPYPATINASVDAELVHGIPDGRPLVEGQIISIDCGAVWKGYVGDSAVTVPVGGISAQARALIAVTQGALQRGIAECRVGKRLGDVSASIQEWVEGHGYQVVRDYTGHGVGQAMHEDPNIPNWGTRDRGPRLKAGMTLALEPMVTVGSPELYTADDRWTVITRDGGLCAHFEHTVAVTDGEPLILTLP